MTDEVTATTTAQVHFVLIGLCTYHRTTGLKQAMTSVRDLEIPQGIRLELIVVDNSKEGSAQHLVQHFAKISDLVIHFHHEPRRGVPFARNRVLDFALDIGSIDQQPQCIAFFDDDESLDSQWLIKYLSYYSFLRQNSRPELILVLTGPVHRLLPEDAPEWSRKAKVFKSPQFASGTQRQWAATNNVFFDTGLIREQGLRFDPSLSFCSGDDQLFFTQASQEGAKVVWVNEAVVRETIGKERATWGWVLKRNYGHGSNGFLIYSKLFPSKKIKGVVLSFCKGILYVCFGLLLLIALGMFTWILPQFRYWTVDALGLISRGLGWICGILGFRYREYGGPSRRQKLDVS